MATVIVRVLTLYNRMDVDNSEIIVTHERMDPY
jgi:hypothetical protein